MPLLQISYWVKDEKSLHRLIWLEKNFTPAYARVLDVRLGRIVEDEICRRLMRL